MFWELLGGMFGNNNQAPVAEINTDDVWSKTSGYTLDDCLAACEKYCIQAQTDACQSPCEIVGKKGKAMDNLVNRIKNITANLNC